MFNSKFIEIFVSILWDRAGFFSVIAGFLPVFGAPCGGGTESLFQGERNWFAQFHPVRNHTIASGIAVSKVRTAMRPQ